VTEVPDRVIRGWGWPPPRRRLADLGRWPYRVGICAALAVAVGVFALMERGALAPPQWTIIVFVSVAVLPWLVDVLLVEVPPWIFAPVVLIPVAILHDPTTFDPLPLLIAVLALDMGLWLGLRRSTPVLAVCAGILALQLAAAPSTNPAAWFRLAPIGLAWLVGLAFHTQLQRMARLRASQRSTIAKVVAGELPRIQLVVRDSVSRRVLASDRKPDPMQAAELAEEVVSELKKVYGLDKESNELE
jgi:hypothetical protein